MLFPSNEFGDLAAWGKSQLSLQSYYDGHYSVEGPPWELGEGASPLHTQTLESVWRAIGRHAGYRGPCLFQQPLSPGGGKGRASLYKCAWVSVTSFGNGHLGPSSLLSGPQTPGRCGSAGSQKPREGQEPQPAALFMPSAGSRCKGPGGSV